LATQHQESDGESGLVSELDSGLEKTREGRTMKSRYLTARCEMGGEKSCKTTTTQGGRGEKDRDLR